MSKEEYTAAIEDNIKFLKEHLSEELFNCLWTGHIIAIMKESIKLLYDNQPSLPSDLDEAAEKAYKEYDVKSAIKPKEYPVGFLFLDGFKSGARWRDAQIPKLPENLDEAAFAYGNRDGITAAQSHAMSIDFKAGAKWRDSQIPKLPDNIDEAAEEYATGLNLGGYVRTINAFKDGAEWLAGQVEEVLLIMAEKGLIPFKDGNSWCILLGENLQEGVSGFGDTITEAIMDFLKDAKAQGIIKETK